MINEVIFNQVTQYYSLFQKAQYHTLRPLEVGTKPRGEENTIYWNQ